MAEELVKQISIKDPIDNTYTKRDIGVDYQNVEGLEDEATVHQAEFALKDEKGSDLKEVVRKVEFNDSFTTLDVQKGYSSEPGSVTPKHTVYSMGMQGASASSGGRAGFVPKPQISDRNKFLKGNGTWAEVANSDAIAPIDSSPASAIHLTGDKFFYNGILYRAIQDIEIGDNLVIDDNIVLSDPVVTPFAGATASTSGKSGLVPAPLIADKDKFLKGDGSWANTSYDDFTGATAQADGEKGLVPGPLVADRAKYLKGDGSWSIPNLASEVTGTLPASNGGTGNTSLQATRNAMGLGNTTGALPVANGGTGQTTLALARNAMGLGNTTGALPIANGGTGATSAAAAAAQFRPSYFNIKNITPSQYSISNGQTTSTYNKTQQYTLTNNAVIVCRVFAYYFGVAEIILDGVSMVYLQNNNGGGVDERSTIYANKGSILKLHVFKNDSGSWANGDSQATVWIYYKD